MFIIFFQAMIFTSAINSAEASADKLAEALRRMEVTLSSEKKSHFVPAVKWQRLKKFEQKIYFTTAHDPSGLPAADVPMPLRSSTLTHNLLNDWTGLISEADTYGINDSVGEWVTFKNLFLNFVDLRNQNLFNQSRKSLKSGALTKSISDLSQYWSKKWYERNPKFTVNYDLQQISELKKLVSEVRTEVSESRRAPANIAEGFQFTTFSTVFTFVLSCFSCFYFGKQFQKRTEITSVGASPLSNSWEPVNFDYEAWVKDFSNGVEALVTERDGRLLRSENFSEAVNALRELRVGIMLATSEDEFQNLAQKLIDMGLELEDLLEQKSEGSENEAFDHVMKTVIRLCVAVEKKQNNELKIAA